MLGADGNLLAGEAAPDARFALARNSTVFFDEIADLPFEAQASLMRLFQHRQTQAPAGNATHGGVDVRIIAATRKDLKRCIEEGTFRDDLYYRLNVFPIHIPPLHERREDIPPLVWRFVDELSDTYRKPIESIDQASMAALNTYTWPGNARELRNVVERAMMVATGRRLTIAIPANGSGRGHRRRETIEPARLAAAPLPTAAVHPRGNNGRGTATGSSRQSTRTRRLGGRAGPG
jgi:transcriptional regulator with PAS, ATPase and Fis domain